MASEPEAATETSGRQIADTVLAGFVDYIASFRKVSRRAATHFTYREWAAQEDDSRQRLALHRANVMTTVGCLADSPKPLQIANSGT